MWAWWTAQKWLYGQCAYLGVGEQDRHAQSCFWTGNRLFKQTNKCRFKRKQTNSPSQNQELRTALGLQVTTGKTRADKNTLFRPIEVSNFAFFQQQTWKHCLQIPLLCVAYHLRCSCVLFPKTLAWLMPSIGLARMLRGDKCKENTLNHETKYKKLHNLNRTLLALPPKDSLSFFFPFKLSSRWE